MKKLLVTIAVIAAISSGALAEACCCLFQEVVQPDACCHHEAPAPTHAPEAPCPCGGSLVSGDMAVPDALPQPPQVETIALLPAAPVSEVLAPARVVVSVSQPVPPPPLLVTGILRI